MFALLSACLRNTAATWHRSCGRVWFRLNAHDRARRHFERVLQLLGDDFVAYVYLGRIAYGLGDYAGWRREFEHARRTGPERFARLKYPFELFEPRAAGALVEEASERATWRTVRAPLLHENRERSSLSRGRVAHGRRGEGADEGCEDRPLRRYGDDFRSEQERDRFRRLPALRVEDLRRAARDAELEALSRRLQADRHDR